MRGKTTLVTRLTSKLYSSGPPPYVVNLDPACLEVPYPANVDIRDTVNYKEVMKQYGLGPNGAIVTCLNLFSTKFDQLLALMKKNQGHHKYYIFDTPGQIEVFTWSASGNIITEALASTFPTVVVYVMDTSSTEWTKVILNTMVQLAKKGNNWPFASGAEIEETRIFRSVLHAYTGNSQLNLKVPHVPLEERRAQAQWREAQRSAEDLLAKFKSTLQS